MKLTTSLLLLVTIWQVAEVKSSRSEPKREGEPNPTAKRTLPVDPGYGIHGALYRKGLLHPGLDYHHPYAGVPHPGKISDVLHSPHLAHSAIASHLYSPISPYHHHAFDYSPLAHLGYHGHHDKSDNEDSDSSGEERESERPKSDKTSKKSKSKKSKRPSSKSSSRSDKKEEKHHDHHEYDEHKYSHLDYPHLPYAHLPYPHNLLYQHHHLYPHLRAGLHYPYHNHPAYYQPHLGLGHHAINPYLTPVQYVQQAVEQQVVPGTQYVQDVQQQQIQQQQAQQPQQVQQQVAPQQVQPQVQQQQIPQAQAQGAVSYASFSQSLPQSYQQQIAQPVIQGQLYQPQLQVLQPQPLFQLLGVQPVNFQLPQALVPTPAPEESFQSQPPNLFSESPQPVTQSTLFQPIPTQPTLQSTTLASSSSELQPVVTIRPTSQTVTSTTTPRVVEILPTKATDQELQQEADNSISNSRAYLTPLVSQAEGILLQEPQFQAVATISPAFYGK